MSDLTERLDEFRERLRGHGAGDSVLIKVSEFAALIEAARVGVLLKQLRTAGWVVAAHNDYRLNGVAHTFWLFTHPDGRYRNGEGTSDVAALEALLAKDGDE